MRIIFDMDGTLVGAFPERRGIRYRLNPRLMQAARNFRAQGHELIIWTFGNRHWWRQVRAWWPELLEIFTEVYTRDELRAHITRARYYAHGVAVDGHEPVKDIRVIGGDMLIDNDPAHKRWAERHGLGDRYVLVDTYGEEAA